MTSLKSLFGWTAIFFVCLVLRLPSLWIPIIDIDESQFAVYANVLLDGGLPYVDSVDTKPLGIYWFYAAIFYFFGPNNMTAVHIVTILWVLATAWYCRKIASYFGSKQAGWLAALFYVVFSSVAPAQIISTSIVSIMMLPLTMSIWHLVRWEENKRFREPLLSGIFFGIACLFKYQAGINLFVVLTWFICMAVRSPKKETLVGKGFFLFLAGGIFIGALFSVYLKMIGVWNDFVFYSFKGGVAYLAAENNINDFFRNLVKRGGAFIMVSLFLWYFALRGAIKPNQKNLLVIIWLIFSVIVISFGGRFYGHYFIQIIPPLAILAAQNIDAGLTRINGNPFFWLWKRPLRFFLAGAISLAFVFSTSTAFNEKLEKYHVFQRHKKIARYIGERSTPDDPIFVWGFATPVYFYSNRMPSSRFLWSDWLTGRTAGASKPNDPHFDSARLIARRSWQHLFDDFSKKPPLYFVDTAAGNFRGYKKYAISHYSELMKYLQTQYSKEVRVGGADIYRRKSYPK